MEGTMWATEKQFGNYIMRKLDYVGFQSIRVESASTISGMPDLYVLGCGDDYFIELKNMKDKSINDGKWKIQWRPGQQAWAQQYNLHMNCTCTGYVKCKSPWTFVGLKDGVLLINMKYYYRNSTARSDNHFVYVFDKDEFSKLNLSYFLRTHTYTITPIPHDDDTWYSYINRCMVTMLDCLFHVSEDKIDYPTPDVYCGDIKIPENSEYIETVKMPSDKRGDFIITDFNSILDDKLDKVRLFTNHTHGWLMRYIAEQAYIVYATHIQK